MRALLHLVSFTLMVPSLVFASGFLLLGHAIGDGSLLGFVSRLLSDALWLVSGGLLVVLACLCAVLIGGFASRTRYLAAACVAALSLGSAIVLIVLGTGGGFLLLLAALLSLCGSGWLALKEWPRAAPLDAVREAGQRKPSS